MQNLMSDSQENYGQFKKILEFSPLPVLMTKGISAEIEYVNPAWEKTTGFMLEEVKGKNPNILKSNKTPPEIHKKIWEELQQGNTYKTELLFDKRKDGTEFQLSSTFYPVKQNGAPIFYVQIEHDITARKIREKYKMMHINIALRLASSATIQEAVPDTLQSLCEGTGWEIGELWLVNQNELHYHGSWHTPSLQVKEFISQCKKLTFTRGKGLPGRVWQTGDPSWIIDASNNTYFPNLFTTDKYGIKTALAFPIQIDFKTIGVLTFFTRETHTPNDDLLETMRSLGNHLGQFIEHKRAEEKLERLTIRQKLILNAIGQGVYGVDNNGIITFINPAAEEMLGWKYEELIGKKMHNIIHYTKNDQHTPLDYKQCPNVKFRQKNTKPFAFDKEIFWKKDGTSFPVEYIITPVPYNNKVVGSVVTFTDITKRNQLENLKKEFLATAAHELKTPITTLKLLSQHQIIKLKKNTKLLSRDFELINHELDRLIRIINDILDDQRTETGKLKLNIETIDLTCLVDEIVEQMKYLSTTHNIIFKKSNNIHINADADRLKQVLTNLISNAIKYSPNDKNIIVKIIKLKKTVNISVIDHGIGVPDDKQEKIFGRFYQIQEGKHGGFGLGLHISKYIIEQHHGKIWVKSRVGEGSTFSFSLPLIK